MDRPTLRDFFARRESRPPSAPPDPSLLESHRLRLLVVSGPDRGVEHEVGGTCFMVGSAPDNDLVLSDSTVSRHHCEIVVKDDRYLLRDLNSTNGTLLDHTPVVEAYLTPGIRLRLGETELVFQTEKTLERISDFKTDHFGELYGTSESMRGVFSLLSKLAPTEISCLVTGETGTGKELAARALHAASLRAEKAFIVVDCGAVSGSLIESELFGHEKGSFTGADRQRVGAFEAADGGTIFLDEIGELPLELQPKLLRALERREVKRIGSNFPVHVDVRVVSATNRDLPSMVRNEKFRGDLYYRLAEMVVSIPSLRERLEDIPLLASRIIEEQQHRGGKVKEMDAEVLKSLTSRQWHGNVRELKNFLRRAMAFARDATLRTEDIQNMTEMVRLPEMRVAVRTIRPAASTSEREPTMPVRTQDMLAADELSIKEARERWMAPMEKQYLRRLLERCDWDLDRAAEKAGIHRKSLERLLRQHNIRRA